MTPLQLHDRYVKDHDPVRRSFAKRLGLGDGYDTQKYYAWLDPKNYPQVRLRRKHISSIASFFAIEAVAVESDFVRRGGRVVELEKKAS